MNIGDWITIDRDLKARRAGRQLEVLVKLESDLSMLGPFERLYDRPEFADKRWTLSTLLRKQNEMLLTFFGHDLEPTISASARRLVDALRDVLKD